MFELKQNYNFNQHFQHINNIKMTSSLPKIKTQTNNSQSGSQKQLKFFKIKLNTSQSQANIRQRFKSVRTQRLSNLQRYSTTEEQRQYKKEKIQINLLQRKLLSGKYDEETQRGNDLHILKQKTDFYKSQTKIKLSEIEKFKRLIEDFKQQINKYSQQKVEVEEIVTKIQIKHNSQKTKAETIVAEKTSLQHMINDRQKTNLFLQARINECKTYLAKLKTISKQTDGELRQATQYMANYNSKMKQTNEEILKNQRKRQQAMYEKQNLISKRKDDQKLRQQKSFQYKKSLDEADILIQKKGLANITSSVLGNLFIEKYCNITQNRLQFRYQIMENMYKTICSFRKFQEQQPIQMVERFKSLKQQGLAYQEIIKKLQNKQSNLQQLHFSLLQKNKQSKITNKKQNKKNVKQQLDSTQKFDEEQRQQIQHQKRLTKLSDETLQLLEKINKIGRWSEKYALQMNIKTKKYSDWANISKNINNIIKVALNEKQNVKN